MILFVKLRVLIFAVSAVPTAVIIRFVDGSAGKSSGPHGFVGSANCICPEDKFTICDGVKLFGIRALLLTPLKTTAAPKLTGKC